MVFVAMRPSAPPFRSQVEGAPVEVGNEVRVAVAFVVERLEPVGVTSDVAGRDGVLSRERGIPDECIEPRVLAVEDFGELDLPVERGERRVVVALLLQPGEVADRLAFRDRGGELEALRLPLLRLRLGEERGEGEVAVEPNLVDFVARVVPEIVKFPVGDLVACVPDSAAKLRHLRHVLADPA